MMSSPHSTGGGGARPASLAQALNVPIRTVVSEVVIAYSNDTNGLPSILFVFSSSLGEKSWRVARRYSDLKELHSHLAKHTSLTLPPFPPSHFFLRTNKSRRRVLERAHRIDEYLTALIPTVQGHHMAKLQLLTFLYPYGWSRGEYVTYTSSAERPAGHPASPVMKSVWQLPKESVHRMFSVAIPWAHIKDTSRATVTIISRTADGPSYARSKAMAYVELCRWIHQKGDTIPTVSEVVKQLQSLQKPMPTKRPISWTLSMASPPTIPTDDPLGSWGSSTSTTSTTTSTVGHLSVPSVSKIEKQDFRSAARPIPAIPNVEPSGESPGILVTPPPSPVSPLGQHE